MKLMKNKSDNICTGYFFRIAFETAALVLLIAGGASALSNDGGGSWQYYRDITLNNPSAALTDYQVLVNLTLDGFPTNANQSGADIRFTDTGGAELSYWIESWDHASKSAKIWVKVPSIPTAATTIRMYYGNPSATSSSNGEITFDFFDDFETNTIGTKWQINNGGLQDTSDTYAYIDSVNGQAVIDSVWDESFVSKSFFINRPTIVEMKWNFEGPFAGQGYTGAIQYYDPATTLNFNLYSYHAFSNSNGALVRYGGTSGPSDYGPDIIYYVSPNTWNIQRLTITSGTIRSSLLNIDHSELSYAQIDNNEWNNKKVGMDNFNDGTAGAKLYIDYFLVRKYASPEPSVSVGAEQTAAVKATIDVDPDTLNLMSNGEWITAYIELPVGYDVNNIVVSTIILKIPPGDVTVDSNAPATVGDYDSDGVSDLMVKFDRSKVVDQLSLTDVVDDGTRIDQQLELTIVGELANGTSFKDTDTIRVIKKGK